MSLACTIERDMGLGSILIWTCSLAGVSCGSLATPDIAIIQAAYDQEEAIGSTLHDRGLRIVEASCDAPVGERSLCQVTFLSKDDPDQRLYFDVIAVDGRNGRWTLASGLCKR